MAFGGPRSAFPVHSSHLGAVRIGHGIATATATAKDPELMRYLAEHDADAATTSKLSAEIDPLASAPVADR